MFENSKIKAEFDGILEDMTEKGISLTRSLKERQISSSTFYKFLDEDSTKQREKDYVRACEQRAERLFARLEELRDEDYGKVTDEYGNTRIDNGFVQRRKLEIDTIKWELSKLLPKKYGDKLDIDAKHDISDEMKQLLQPFTKKKE